MNHASTGVSNGAHQSSRRPWAWAVGGLFAILCLAGCATPPEPVLVALPSTARGADTLRSAAALQAEAPTAPVLLVRRLSIPEYMVARRVRYTAETARLAEWPDTYWAERIEIGMARELVAALRDALPTWRVCDASCGDTAPDVTLKVELTRLDVLRGERRIVATAQTQISLAKPAPSTTAVFNVAPVTLVTPAATVNPATPTTANAPPAASTTFVQPLPADSAQGQAQAMSDLLRSMADTGAGAVLRARSAKP